MKKLNSGARAMLGHGTGRGVPRGRGPWPRSGRSAAGAAASLSLALVAGTGAMAVLAPAQAAPVAQQAATLEAGEPADPRELFLEDFENFDAGQGVLATSLESYTGAKGQTHTADASWLDTAECNGVLVRYGNFNDEETVTFPEGWCVSPSDNPVNRGEYTSQGRANVRRLADVLGQVKAGVVGGATSDAPANGSTEATRGNHAVTAWTYSKAVTPGEDVQFETSAMDLGAKNPRFILASVDVAEGSCTYQDGANNSRLWFELHDGTNRVTNLSTGAIQACRDEGVGYYTSPNTDYIATDGSENSWGHPGGTYVAAGNYFVPSAILVDDAALNDARIIMRNETLEWRGNDFAFDNIELYDVTPRLDKAFSPESVHVGETSTLTLTVTNTSELGSKEGWSFTDNLPDGLTVAQNPNVRMTCDADVEAAGGSTSIAVTNGNLADQEVSCTISVDVTSDSPRGAEPSPKQYQNCEANITDTVGIDSPDCATVEFYSVPALTLTKTSNAGDPARVGDVVTFTVTAKNTGDGDFTEAAPAVVLDDLTGMLDDADYAGDARATYTGQSGTAPAPTYTEPVLSWSGPLAVGASVSLTYTATVKGGGDGHGRNVAWQPRDPEQPTTPACEPAVPTAIDSVTGEPCATTDFDVPVITVVKSADPESGTAVGRGQTVTYTLAFSYAGAGTTVIHYTDDLRGVLDDATFVEVVDAGGLTVTGPDASGALHIEGRLDAGTSVVYRVRVKEHERGDNMLRNVVVDSPTLPEVDPGCPPGMCTEHPVQYLSVVKAGDPGGVAIAGATFVLREDVDGLPGDVLTLSPDGTGRVVSGAIQPGTYWLEESKAPEGRHLLAAPVRFEVGEDGSLTLSNPEADAGAVQVTLDADGMATLTVTDPTPFALPLTGGSGASGYWITGGLLLAAGVYLMVRRRAGAGVRTRVAEVGA